MATKVVDYSKYYKSFLSTDDIQSMAAQLCRTDGSFLSTILLSVRAAALAALYWMFDREKEKQLMIDKQRMEQELQDDIDDDNNVVT